MAKWEQLIAARERKHLSQMEAAEHLHVGLVTYQRWELGKRKPQPQHMRRLCESFGLQLEIDRSISSCGEGSARTSEPDTHPVSRESMSTPVDAPAAAIKNKNELRTLLTATLTSHLWSLTFLDHATGNEKRDVIRQAIKEYDSMNTDNKNYQITRREALWSLATLPIITLGLSTPGNSVSSSHYSSAIAHCAASLEPCWELYRSGDPGGTELAFKCSSTYLSMLQAIGKDSPSHREEALDLAARYALLKTLLGWICVGPNETLHYAREAVALSKETGDISLQLSAYSKLAWAYFYLKKHALALSTAQEAEGLLLGYALSPESQPLHACVQGGTYSTLALMQAKNGQAPYHASGKAFEADPQESYAFMTSKYSALLLEAGWTYCYYGDQAKAMSMLEKRVDPETLVQKVAQATPNGRIETINVMVLSSLRSKDRDMEKTIHLWMAGIQGAKNIKSEQRFIESLAAYELMEVVWPDERRIIELRDCLVHWREES